MAAGRRNDRSKGLSLELRSLLERGVRGWAAAAGSDPRRLVMEVAAPSRPTPLPDAAFLQSLRGEVVTIITRLGHAPQLEGAPGKINFGLLAALASAFEDPDAAYPLEVAKGVPVGVTTDEGTNPLPRAPAIYEAKTKWALPELGSEEWHLEHARWATNYPSARVVAATLAKQFEEEIGEDCMLRMSLGEARRRWGNKLTIAALGAIEKTEGTFRVIYDASNTVRLNHRIRVQDQCRMPVWQDIGRYVEDISSFSGVRFGMAFDIRRAHRQIPIREEDWGYLACRLDDKPEHEAQDNDEVFVNTVGTFGVGSAAYYWSRLAAIAVRLGYKVASQAWLVYFLLYVDDGLIAAMGTNFEYGVLGILLLLQVLGFPLAGNKFRGGTQIPWIGYQVDLAAGTLGITADRLASTLAWCEATAAAKVVLIRDFRSALGKLVFVAGPLFHIRPFLGPAFSWASAATGGTAMAPPIAVRAAIKWVGVLLELPYPEVPAGRPRPRGAFQGRRQSRGRRRGLDRRVVDGARGRPGVGEVVRVPGGRLHISVGVRKGATLQGDRRAGVAGGSLRSNAPRPSSGLR